MFQGWGERSPAPARSLPDLEPNFSSKVATELGWEVLPDSGQSGNARIYPTCKAGPLGINGVRGPSYNPTRVLISCIAGLRNLKLCTTSHITRSIFFVFHMSDDYPLFTKTPIQPQPTLLKFKIAPWKLTFPIQPSFCRGDILNFGGINTNHIFSWGGCGRIHIRVGKIMFHTYFPHEKHKNQEVGNCQRWQPVSCTMVSSKSNDRGWPQNWKILAAGWESYRRMSLGYMVYMKTQASQLVKYLFLSIWSRKKISNLFRNTPNKSGNLANKWQIWK